MPEFNPTTEHAPRAWAQAALISRRDAVLERLEDAASSRGDRAEVVHQLRVSSRRADAALAFFLPWLPPKRTAHLRKKLKALRRAAGRVRDCDVLKPLIREAPGKQRKELKRRLKRRHKASERNLTRLVKKLWRNDRLARAWGRVLKPDDASQAPQSALQFRNWEWEQFRSWLNEFANQSLAALDSLEQLHAFRLEGKRLRYALELMPPHAEGPTASELLELLKDLQQRLGEVCDLRALRKQLEKWAAGKTSKRLTLEVEAAATREESLLASLRQDWPTLCLRLDGIVARRDSALPR